MTLPLVTTRAALAGLAAAVVFSTAGCSGGESPAMAGDTQSATASVADSGRVAAGDETEFVDLPGIPGFDSLSEEMRLEVLDRSNITHCSCGCAGHSVAACLQQEEKCDVAHELVTGFVDDALTFMNETGGKAAPTDDPPPPPGGTGLDTETKTDAASPANEPD